MGDDLETYHVLASLKLTIRNNKYNNNFEFPQKHGIRLYMDFVRVKNACYFHLNYVQILLPIIKQLLCIIQGAWFENFDVFYLYK